MEADTRSDERRAKDEAIAGEAPLAAPKLAEGAVGVLVENLLRRGRRRPVALAGVVENGVVRLVGPGVKLPERARVIVVAEGA